MRRATLCLAVFATALTLSGCGRNDFVEIPFAPDFVGLVEGGRLTQVEIIRNPSGVTSVVGEAMLDEGSETPTLFRVAVTELDSVQELLIKNQVGFHFPPQNPADWQCVSGLIPIVIVLCWVAIIILAFSLAVRFVRAVERIAKNTEK